MELMVNLNGTCQKDGLGNGVIKKLKQRLESPPTEYPISKLIFWIDICKHSGQIGTVAERFNS